MSNSTQSFLPSQVFTFQTHELRTFIVDGDPRWPASDVCQILGLTGNASQHTRRLDDDEKGMISSHTPGGVQQILVVNEPGLYALILHSRKPEAKVFKRWVTHEVLPAVRKTGNYSASPTSSAMFNPPPEVVVHTYGPAQVPHRVADGYFQASGLVSAGLLSLADYFIAPGTQEFVQALSKKLQRSITELVVCDPSDPGRVEGIRWFHPAIAAHAARRSSFGLAQAVVRWIQEWESRSGVSSGIAEPAGTVHAPTTPDLATVGGTVAFAKLLLALAEKNQELETRLASLEKQHADALGAFFAVERSMVKAPQKTTRACVVDYINKFVRASGVSFEAAFNRAFHEFKMRAHFDVKARTKSRKGQPWLEIIEECGHIEQFFAVVCEVLVLPTNVTSLAAVPALKQ